MNRPAAAPPSSSPYDDGELDLDSDHGSGPARVLVPALVSDMARMFRQAGIESFRASVVDMASLSFQAAWTLTDSGEVSDHSPDRPLDSQFPGALASINQLSHAAPEHTVVQRLSPRRWSYAWRLDAQHVVIAEARYRDMRSTVSPTDTALVRLVCDTGIRGGQTRHAQPGEPSTEGDALWPLHLGDSGAHPLARWSRPTAVGLALGASVLALWLALAAVPGVREGSVATQAEVAKLRAIADNTMVHNLSSAMATGDYGEVQSELSSLEALGYFESAAVLNTRQRVVALARPGDGLRIGGDLPAEAASEARRFELSLGSERYGQLVVLRQTVTPPVDAKLGQLRLGATTVALCSALAALLLLLRPLRGRARQAATGE